MLLNARLENGRRLLSVIGGALYTRPWGGHFVRHGRVGCFPPFCNESLVLPVPYFAESLSSMVNSVLGVRSYLNCLDPSLSLSVFFQERQDQTHLNQHVLLYANELSAM